MFAGLPVSHSGAGGGTFGPWQVIDVTSGSDDSGYATLPSYRAGDFVYLATYLSNRIPQSSSGFPAYPSVPTAPGFLNFGTDTRQYVQAVTVSGRYSSRVSDMGKIMQVSDVVTSVPLEGTDRRWCALTLRNGFSEIDRAVGPISIGNATISRSISYADKPLVIGFAASFEANSPTLTPPGDVLVDETGTRATSRIITLYDPPPSSVEIAWNIRDGKIIRQIDFT